ncbi:hypothetical protein [Stutzerimonas kunmingensis]|uniref:RipA family octameric membrane protein n=1 Tax=Stutzerimonas kunmingensis TaxID=1211807 RepID=UPI00241FB318|nr:hypothetical protein [Stutzerimonas kunmingensis]
MSEKDERLESLKSLYEISISTRNFEIGQLIHRNNFFMLFQGVLLASVIQAENSRPFVEFVICVAGLCVSIYQMQMASGAKFWQEWWESRVEYFETLLCERLKASCDADVHELFTVPLKDVTQDVAARISLSKQSVTNSLMLARYSVGRAPMKVSVALIFTWIALMASTLNLSVLEFIPDLIVGFPVKQIS